jgi:hypothetical protein
VLDDLGIVDEILNLGRFHLPFRDMTERPCWAAANVFVDALGHMAEAYGGGQGEYVLVRPDGYVAWTGLERISLIFRTT